MRLLLDTHTLLWWWLGDRRLSRKLISYLEDAGTELHISAVSALEIATKVRIGKLPEASELINGFEASLSLQGIRELPVSVTHARRAGLLQSRHRDPFDRILAAQSIIEDLPIVSGDVVLGSLGAQLIW